MTDKDKSIESWDEMLELITATTQGIYSLLQFIIHKIHRDFRVDRIGFFAPENGHYVVKLKFEDPKLLLEAHLPRIGEKYPLEEEVYLKRENEDPLIITPRPGIGFDIYMVVRSRDQILGILALDDTTSRRKFSDDERAKFRRLVAVINSLISNHDMFSDLMYVDSLTTIFNRRYYDEQFSGLIAPGDTIAMIDVDHFKQVNDTHGHPMGDAVLSELGRLLKKSLRPEDFVFRYGGEEFLVLFKDCSTEAAYWRLQYILETFSETNIRNDGELMDEPVTFSAGLHYHEKGSWKKSVEAADAMLYQAKENGRSRVEK